MAKDEEIEGMFTLVGDPENPDLESIVRFSNLINFFLSKGISGI